MSEIDCLGGSGDSEDAYSAERAIDLGWFIRTNPGQSVADAVRARLEADPFYIPPFFPSNNGKKPDL